MWAQGGGGRASLWTETSGRMPNETPQKETLASALDTQLGETHAADQTGTALSLRPVALLANTAKFPKAAVTKTSTWNTRCPEAIMRPTASAYKGKTGEYVGVAMTFKCLPTRPQGDQSDLICYARRHLLLSSQNCCTANPV